MFRWLAWSRRVAREGGIHFFAFFPIRPIGREGGGFLIFYGHPVSSFFSLAIQPPPSFLQFPGHTSLPTGAYESTFYKEDRA